MKSFFFKPVRTIRPSHRSIRGQITSAKNRRVHNYESSLERDLLQILEFDDHVESFCEQPVTIEYIHEGVISQYTPDVLIFYRNDLEPSRNLKPTLCEVKYRADLKQDWATLKPKFRAALRYADQNGWKFKLLTEREIRTDYLTNVRFLLNYTGDHAQITSTDHQLLMSLMYDIRFTTVEELLLMATNDKSRRAELLYAVWHLVAVGVISCDLTIELSLQAEIWIR